MITINTNNNGDIGVDSVPARISRIIISKFGRGSKVELIKNSDNLLIYRVIDGRGQTTFVEYSTGDRKFDLYEHNDNL